jgi:hypothetical protein
LLNRQPLSDNWVRLFKVEMSTRANDISAIEDGWSHWTFNPSKLMQINDMFFKLLAIAWKEKSVHIRPDNTSDLL